MKIVIHYEREGLRNIIAIAGATAVSLMFWACVYYFCMEVGK